MDLYLVIYNQPSLQNLIDLHIMGSLLNYILACFLNFNCLFLHPVLVINLRLLLKSISKSLFNNLDEHIWLGSEKQIQVENLILYYESL